MGRPNEEEGRFNLTMINQPMNDIDCLTMVEPVNADYYQSLFEDTAVDQDTRHYLDLQPHHGIFAEQLQQTY